MIPNQPVAMELVVIVDPITGEQSESYQPMSAADAAALSTLQTSLQAVAPARAPNIAAAIMAIANSPSIDAATKLALESALQGN